MQLMFLFIFGGAIGCLAIGVVYFIRAKGAASLPVRAVTSAYAPVVSMAFAAGVLVPREFWAGLGRSSFLLVQLLPLALLVLSLLFYPGDKKTHWYLAPITLFLWAWQIFVAQLLIHGK